MRNAGTPMESYNEVSNPDPVYDGTNTELPKRFDLLTSALSKQEASDLNAFLVEKFSDIDVTTRSIDLSYRPEDWDDSGVIEKLHNIVREHIKQTYKITGSLNPRRFTLLRTTDVQTYSETYGDYNANNEILYTAIYTAPNVTDYYSGETLYNKNGEGFFPSGYDVVIHRNEELNNWEILDVVKGQRLDLLMVFEEIDRGVSYDYPIDQLEDDGVGY